MPASTAAPIKKALVATLRANATLKAALKGGIHEGFAPEKVDYPTLAYQLIADPLSYPWGSLMQLAIFDIRIFDQSSVNANNVDALVFTTLNDAALSVTGQSTLYCRRLADLSSVDVDEEGRKVYMVGGSYEIWTDQPYP